MLRRFAAWLLVAALIGEALAACTTDAGPGRTGQAEGTIRVMDGPAWLVGQQLVTVPPDAVVTGRPAVGATAKVTGMWGDAGELIVRRAEIGPGAAAAVPTQAATPVVANTTPTSPPPAPAASPTATPRPAPPAVEPAVRPAAPAVQPARPAAPARRRGEEDDGD